MGKDIVYLQITEGGLEQSTRSTNSREKGEGKCSDKFGVDKLEECFYAEF